MVLKTRIIQIILVYVALTPQLASSQRPTCISSWDGGVICPRHPNGGIAANGIGVILCGKGQCVKDGLGRVWCSKDMGGFAGVNALGQPACSGGCESGSSSLCQELKP